MGSDRGKRVCLDGAQRELVSRHLGLVRLHLRTRVFLPKTATRDREAEDLYQEGCLGLMRAAMTYDASRHGEFEPYALARIRGAVHEAIYERFATVRVPLRTIARQRAAARRAGRTSVRGSTPEGWVRCSDLGEDVRRVCDVEGGKAIGIGGNGDAPGEDDSDTVGCHLRGKLRIALAVAVDRMAGRCRRPGTRAVLEAIAAERLAIPDAQGRTALRAISRRFGVSVGRAVAWQRGLEREARQWLAGDREFELLRGAAAHRGEGGDWALDAGLER
ncbi:MAG: sigma-70 family RNA polymerase sigma factor, partial [Phycisphaerae bacterium]